MKTTRLTTVILGTVLLGSLLMPSQAQAARLYTSGFEQQTNTAGEEFSSNGIGTGGVQTTTKRTGAAAMRINPTGANSWMGQVFKSGVNQTESFCRIYFNYATRPSSGTPEVMGFWNSGAVTRQGYVRYDSTNNTLELRDATGTQVGSDSATISASTWYRLELRLIGGSGADSTLEAKLDGTTIATQTLGPGGSFDACYLGAASETGTYDMYIDDWAINDTSGSAQTGYPGNGSIVMVVPTAQGDGEPSGCNNTSPCGDSNTWNRIDEVNPNDATDFIDIDTAIDADWNVTDSSTAGIDSYDTITLVQVNARTREEAAAATQFHMRIKSASGGSTSSTSNVDLGNTTWRTSASGGNNNMLNRLVSYTDPTTGVAWTPTGTNSVDNMQLSVGIGDSDDVDVSTVWANVEYVDGSPPASGRRIIMPD
jgi:hypothetical protein